MQIFNINPFNINKSQKASSDIHKTSPFVHKNFKNLTPLAKDTISFSANAEIEKNKMEDLLVSNGFKKEDLSEHFINYDEEKKNIITEKYGYSYSNKLYHDHKHSRLKQGDLIIYSKKANEEDMETLGKNFSQKHAKLLSQRLGALISDSEMENLTKLFNANDSKYSKYWEKNLDEFVIFYSTMRGLIGKEDVQSAILDNAADNFINQRDDFLIQSVENYKGTAYKKINKQKIQNENHQKQSEALRNAMQQSPLSGDTTVYRTEDTRAFDKVQLKNGDLLGLKMREIKSLKSKEKKAHAARQLRDIVLSEKVVLDRTKFTSTTVASGTQGATGDVRWELKLPEGTKGMYLESLNYHGYQSSELEYLIDKNSKIEILDMQYLPKKDKWQMTGRVVQ